MNLEHLARKRPILALLLAPCMGFIFIWFLPFVGWFVLLRAIVARLRRARIRSYTRSTISSIYFKRSK